MKWMIGAVALLLGCCTAPAASQAKEQGKSQGRSESSLGRKVGQVTGQAAEEIIDAVADELLDADGRVTTSGARPPGLSKKDKMPPGLEKQGKVPEGWSKGKKSGWDASEETKREGLIRRIVRGIFGGGKKRAEAKEHEE